MDTSITIENESKKDLFSPIQLGQYTLKNRIIMAPLTRCRADENNIPTEMNRIYYQQRASAGLIITEGTQISPQGAGYPNTPGIYNQDQINAWKIITESVHAKGNVSFYNFGMLVGSVILIFNLMMNRLLLLYYSTYTHPCVMNTNKNLRDNAQLIQFPFLK